MTPNKKFARQKKHSDQLTDDHKVIQYINLKLIALGAPIYECNSDSEFLELSKPLLVNHMEKSRRLSKNLSPSGRRIQDFLNE